MTQKAILEDLPLLPDHFSDEALEEIVWYLFTETLRDAVKIGQRKAHHFRNNIGGNGIKNDRPHKGAQPRNWTPSKAEKALQEATERLDLYLDSSFFTNILLSLGREVQPSVQYLREIMQGQHINAATKGLNQIKKKRQMKAKEKNLETELKDVRKYLYPERKSTDV